MRLVKHTIIDINTPATYNEWRLLFEMDMDKMYSTDKAMQMICSQTDSLIDQANEILTFNR